MRTPCHEVFAAALQLRTESSAAAGAGQRGTSTQMGRAAEVATSSYLVT